MALGQNGLLQGKSGIRARQYDGEPGASQQVEMDRSYLSTFIVTWYGPALPDGS